MMPRFYRLLVALTLFCASFAGTCGGPRPDYHDEKNRLSVWYHVPERYSPFLLSEANKVILTEAWRVCPDKYRHSLFLLWCASIDFMTDPFHCEGRESLAEQREPPTYNGCVVMECAVQVGYRKHLWETALIDELGHNAWSICFQRVGEHRDDHGEPVYDPDFEAWVARTRIVLRNVEEGIERRGN